MKATALEPARIRHVQVDYINGVSIDGLAEKYGVSRRTIYRLIKVRLDLIRLEGWSAWFAFSAKKAPQRLTPWEAA